MKLTRTSFFAGNWWLFWNSCKLLKMKLTLAFAIVVFLCACGSAPAPSDRTTPPVARNENPANEARDGGERTHGRHHHRNHGGSGTGYGAPANAAAGATLSDKTPGNFDVYVMSLSWSPGFCETAAGQNDPLQCGPQRHFAFVLHGLWPQYEARGWPEDCSTEQVDQATVHGMLSLMPSPKLVEHEWSKHGTCSGLSSTDFFEDASDYFESVTIPPAYAQLSRELTVSPDKLTEDFVAANPRFDAQGFVVVCTRNGRYLEEIHACLTKDGEARACNREVQKEACRSDQIVMRPVR